MGAQSRIGMSSQTAFNAGAVAVLRSSRNASVAAAVSARRRQEPHFHVEKDHVAFQVVHLSVVGAVRRSYPPRCGDGNGSLSFKCLERLVKEDAILRAGAQQSGRLSLSDDPIRSVQSIQSIQSLNAGVPSSHLPAADPAEFGIPRLGNRPRMYLTALFFPLVGTAASRSARRGGHQQRAHPRRPITQRTGIHPGVPRLPNNNRPMCP